MDDKLSQNRKRRRSHPDTSSPRHSTRRRLRNSRSRSSSQSSNRSRSIESNISSSSRRRHRRMDRRKKEEKRENNLSKSSDDNSSEFESVSSLKSLKYSKNNKRSNSPTGSRKHTMNDKDSHHCKHDHNRSRVHNYKHKEVHSRSDRNRLNKRKYRSRNRSSSVESNKSTRRTKKTDKNDRIDTSTDKRRNTKPTTTTTVSSCQNISTRVDKINKKYKNIKKCKHNNKYNKYNKKQRDEAKVKVYDEYPARINSASDEDSSISDNGNKELDKSSSDEHTTDLSEETCSETPSLYDHDSDINNSENDDSINHHDKKNWRNELNEFDKNSVKSNSDLELNSNINTVSPITITTSVSKDTKEENQIDDVSNGDVIDDDTHRDTKDLDINEIYDTSSDVDEIEMENENEDIDHDDNDDNDDLTVDDINIDGKLKENKELKIGEASDETITLTTSLNVSREEGKESKSVKIIDNEEKEEMEEKIENRNNNNNDIRNLGDVTDLSDLNEFVHNKIDRDRTRRILGQTYQFKNSSYNARGYSGITSRGGRGGRIYGNLSANRGKYSSNRSGYDFSYINSNNNGIYNNITNKRFGRSGSQYSNNYNQNHSRYNSISGNYVGSNNIYNTTDTSRNNNDLWKGNGNAGSGYNHGYGYGNGYNNNSSWQTPTNSRWNQPKNNYNNDITINTSNISNPQPGATPGGVTPGASFTKPAPFVAKAPKPKKALKQKEENQNDSKKVKKSKINVNKNNKNNKNNTKTSKSVRDNILDDLESLDNEDDDISLIEVLETRKGPFKGSSKGLKPKVIITSINYKQGSNLLKHELKLEIMNGDSVNNVINLLKNNPETILEYKTGRNGDQVACSYSKNKLNTELKILSIDKKNNILYFCLQHKVVGDDNKGHLKYLLNNDGCYNFRICIKAFNCWTSIKTFNTYNFINGVNNDDIDQKDELEFKINGQNEDITIRDDSGSGLLLSRPKTISKPGNNNSNDAINELRKIGFSEERIRAFLRKDTNSNAYFYRFNELGEQQRNGPWSELEHKQFMKRVLEFGVNNEWGTFSKVINGRVGYQCSNYWRLLITNGDVEDPNYVIDPNSRALSFRKGLGEKHDEMKMRFTKFGFKVIKDSSGVFGNQTELPKRHPNAPNEKYIRKMHEWVKENTRVHAQTKVNKGEKIMFIGDSDNNNDKDGLCESTLVLDEEKGGDDSGINDELIISNVDLGSNEVVNDISNGNSIGDNSSGIDDNRLVGDSNDNIDGDQDDNDGNDNGLQRHLFNNMNWCMAMGLMSSVSEIKKLFKQLKIKKKL